jgi:hypothetical protein
MSEDEFIAAAREDLTASEGEGAATYLHAAPVVQSYLGLKRYWDKRLAA